MWLLRLSNFYSDQLFCDNLKKLFDNERSIAVPLDTNSLLIASTLMLIVQTCLAHQNLKKLNETETLHTEQKTFSQEQTKLKSKNCIKTQYAWCSAWHMQSPKSSQKNKCDEFIAINLVKMVCLVNVHFVRDVDNDEFSYEITSNKLN